MTSQVLLLSFGSEGPRAHYEWAMSEWSPVSPLQVSAIHSKFWDLTSLNVHWLFNDRSCCRVELFLSNSHELSPHLYLYTVYDPLW